jgi:hypothetical protein
MEGNYTTFLTKLKAGLPERAPKKMKTEKTFYPNEAQCRLLNVCGFIDYLNPPGFSTVAEVNNFVTTYVNKRNDFEKEHKSMPCPGMCNIYLFLFLFFNLCFILIYWILFLTSLLHYYRLHENIVT